jgi:RNA polymerase sigma-70 factor (ECF subfamily)
VAKFIAAVSSHFWAGVTLSWIEANGQACVRILRPDGVGALATIGASAPGIDQIMWFMRPSKRAAISSSRQTSSDG